MNLLQLKQHEESLLARLKKQEERVKLLFEDIADQYADIENAEHEVSVNKRLIQELNAYREAGLKDLEATQKVINEELAAGEQQILTDLRNGKVGLVDAETGEPKTIALFLKR